MAAKKSKAKSAPTLLRKIDVVAGVELSEWATVANGAVTGWVSDPAKATLVAFSEAVKIQLEMEKQPDDLFVAMTRDDVTAASLTGGELQSVSDND